MDKRENASYLQATEPFESGEDSCYIGGQVITRKKKELVPVLIVIKELNMLFSIFMFIVIVLIYFEELNILFSLHTTFYSFSHY